MQMLADLVDWMRTLPPDFAFLLALPFLVGAAGLIADGRRRRTRALRQAGRARNGADGGGVVTAG